MTVDPGSRGWTEHKHIPDVASDLRVRGTAQVDGLWVRANSVMDGSLYVGGDVTLPNGVIGTSELAAGAVTEAKIATAVWHAIGAAGEPAFTSGWANYGGYEPAAYMRDAVGTVWLRGLIQGGTVAYPGGTAFTLPVGYRIALAGGAAYCHFPCLANLLPGVIVVNTAGAIVPTNGSNTWFDLSNIHYKAA